MGRLLLVLFTFLALTAFVTAAVTYTAPAPVSSRSDWATNHYSAPVVGLVAVDVATASAADGDTTTSTDLCGYLERIVFSADGTDTAWTLSILDASGVTLFTKTDCNALADPYSFVVSEEDVDGTVFGGVPFLGGLTVRLANADGGSATHIDCRLYIAESWRR